MENKPCQDINVNDLVYFNNDSIKCIYRIEKKEENTLFIKGVNHRINRIVSVDEVQKASLSFIEKEKEYTKKILFKTKNIFVRNDKVKKYLPGKILHIDGDKEYLDKCKELYDEAKLYSLPICIKEDEVERKLENILDKFNPDIIVITGHDLFQGDDPKNLLQYKNTKYFMNAVKKIRKIMRNDCVVIAGACQSNFEALIASGADYASSPKRINIHTFDPAVIAICVATTSFTSLVNDNMFEYIENGKDAFGGVQTYGKMKLIL